MPLTPEQHEQVQRQLRNHDREPGLRSIQLDSRDKLTLVIEHGVFGSDIMSSGIYLARYLHENPELYRGKTVLDMGCGPGTQGIVMAKNGASHVTLADINPKAIANTKRNLAEQKLANAEVYESDLFEDLPADRRYELVVFNHPFFPEEAEDFADSTASETMLKKGMLGGTELVKRFFRDVKGRMDENGTLVMPYFHFAGPENDPANHAESYGFSITKAEKVESDKGLQIGDISIYLISPDAATSYNSSL